MTQTGDMGPGWEITVKDSYFVTGRGTVGVDSRWIEDCQVPWPWSGRVTVTYPTGDRRLFEEASTELVRSVDGERRGDRPAVVLTDVFDQDALSPGCVVEPVGIATAGDPT